MILRTIMMKRSDASSIVRRMNELLNPKTEPAPALHLVRQSILRKLRRRFRIENGNGLDTFSRAQYKS